MGVLEINRPFDGLVVGGSIVMGMFFADNTVTLATMLMGLLTGMFLLGAMDAFNDYKDKESDAISKPHRPIPSGRVSDRLALTITVVNTIVGLALALVLNWGAFLIAVCGVIIAVAYSKKFQRFFLAKNIVVSINLSLGFLFGFMVLSYNFTPEFFLMLTAILIIAFNFEIHKDIIDYKADAAHDIVTVPGKFGIQNATRIIIALYVVALTIALSFAFVKPLNFIFFVFFGFAILCAVVMFLLLLKDALRYFEVTRLLSNSMMTFVIVGIIGLFGT